MTAYSHREATLPEMTTAIGSNGPQPTHLQKSQLFKIF